MKARMFLGAAALALALAGCGGADNNTMAVVSNEPLPQIAAPGGGDWTQMITRTNEGGFLLGNPNAPVKLVEYGSYTCHVCAEFSEQATAPLRDTYVRSGQVSWEYRPFQRNGLDLAMTLLVQCQPPTAAFSTGEQIFSQQEAIGTAIDAQETAVLNALPPDQQIEPLARAADLETFFARRGIPAQRFSQCLANRAEIQRLTDLSNRASTEVPVTGTPTFLINGTKQEVTAWVALEPLLRNAIPQ
jgi:protein-disulfide isomerase